MMRMFTTMSDESGMNLKVFRDLEAAKVWLGLPEDLGDSFEDMAAE